MFSYLKILDICEQNITVSFHGKIKNNTELTKKILLEFMGNASIIYNENDEDFFVVLCKNQTCSKKLTTLDQITEYIKNNL